MNAQDHHNAAQTWIATAADWYNNGHGDRDVMAGILAASIADVHTKLAAELETPPAVAAPPAIPVTDAQRAVAAVELCLAALKGSDNIHLSVTLNPNDEWGHPMVMPSIRSKADLDALAAALGVTPKSTPRGPERIEHSLRCGDISAWWSEKTEPAAELVAKVMSDVA